MTTLGACLISNDLQLSGQALDIFNRRVKGESWANIAKEYNLNSPNAARKLFTKLTGITDYKIKGDDLIQLAKGGIPDELKAPKIKTKKAPQPSAEKVVSAATDVKPPNSMLDEWYDKLHDAMPQQFPKDQMTSWGVPEDVIEALTKLSTTYDELAKIPVENWKLAYEKFAFKIPENMDKFIKQAVSETVQVPQEMKEQWLENLISELHSKGVMEDELGDKFSKLINKNFGDMTAGDVADAYDIAQVQKPKTLFDLLDGKPAPKPTPSQYKFPTEAELKKPLSSKAQAKAPKVEEMWTSGKLENTYYWKIKSETGLNFGDIDDIVWNHNLKAANGDVWKAYKIKENSENAIQAVKDMVTAAKKAGLSYDDISSNTGIPTSELSKIVNGSWKKKPATPSYSGTNAYPHSSPQKVVADGFKAGESVEDLAYKKGTNEIMEADRRRAIRQPGYDASGEKDLTTYTGSAYSRINGALRKGRKTREVRGMDRSMYAVGEDVTVTRGMGVKGLGVDYMDEDIAKSLVGTVIQDKGYLSTSTKPVFQNQVRLNIEMPKGTMGHWVKPISYHSHEDEWLLARGTRMMILGIERKGGKWVVKARVIP